MIKEKTKKKNSLLKKKALLLIPLVFFLSLLYLERGQFVVALVNGQPITRLKLIRELEKQGGKQVLDSLVTETLVFQEAKKQKVSVSQEEINQEIEKIKDNLKQQGQDLDQLLAFQGMSLADLNRQIRLRKIAEKITASQVEVTDQEVEEYLSQNQNMFAQMDNQEEAKSYIKEQLRQEKTNQAINQWLQELRQQANIIYLLPL